MMQLRMTTTDRDEGSFFFAHEAAGPAHRV